MKISTLVPRDKDPSTLNFVSFKIDANDSIAAIITKPNFWPKTCRIKPFVHKTSQIVDLTNTQNNILGKDDQHFLDRRPPPAKIG